MGKLCYVSKGEFSQTLLEKIESQDNLYWLGFVEFTALAGHNVCELVPDVVLFDMDGISEYDVVYTVGYINEKLPDVKIIALTSSEDSSDLLQTVGVGIDSLIVKSPKQFEKIIHTIQEVSNDRFIIPAQAARILIDSIIDLKENNLDLFHQKLYENKIDLTLREAEIAYLMKQGLKNKVIAEKLQLSEGTVKVHISHIYHKLNIKGRKNVVSFLQELMLTKRVFT